MWEPRRIIPAYAVPGDDLDAELAAAPAAAAPAGPHGFTFADGAHILDPSVPFAVHTAEASP